MLQYVTFLCNTSVDIIDNPFSITKNWRRFTQFWDAKPSKLLEVTNEVATGRNRVTMANFKVMEVIDGDTFRVKPRWVSSGNKGDTVRPTGYNTPEVGEPGFEQAKRKLTALIQGEQVTLGKAVNFDHGRIVCAVKFNGKDLSDYFPEYK